MKTVIRTGPGRVELNYMWLPTWLGQNHQLKVELEKTISKEFVGKELTEKTLNEMHEMVVDIILKKHPLPGLFDYLDGLKFVEA